MNGHLQCTGELAVSVPLYLIYFILKNSLSIAHFG